MTLDKLLKNIVEAHELYESHIPDHPDISIVEADICERKAQALAFHWRNYRWQLQRMIREQTEQNNSH